MTDLEETAVRVIQGSFDEISSMNAVEGDDEIRMFVRSEAAAEDLVEAEEAFQQKLRKETTIEEYAKIRITPVPVK